MSAFSWWKKQDRAAPSDPAIIEEKRERQAELAQAVVTFERRRWSVHKTAEQALQRMREVER